MSITDMQALIGRKGFLPVEGGDMSIMVEVRDIKIAYGRVLYLVKPIEGKGSKWVNSERVHLIK